MASSLIEQSFNILTNDESRVNRPTTARPVANHRARVALPGRF
jgi:hypothetical protein